MAGKKDKLSVFLSLVLRHKPEAANISLDNYGWADVELLIKGVNATGRNLSLDVLEEIVKTDEKGRYSFSDDKSKIRANQGHSVDVDMKFVEEIPPDELYHGTAQKSLDGIMRDGLKPMSRQYVHLSKDAKTAIRVGRRHGEPVLLKVNAQKAYKDGYTFFRSTNGVWLVKLLPADYLEKIDLINEEI